MARRGGIRVVAGTARGRRLAVPPGRAVRPTTERVRESVFGALDAAGRLEGASVLDLYAGSGALAIEALSRGAASAVLVDRDRRAAAVATANLAIAGADGRGRVVARDVVAVLRGAPPPEAPFGLVVCDPPYDLSGADLDAVLAHLASPRWTRADAAVVVERRSGGAPAPPPGWDVTWERSFGGTLVVVMVRAGRVDEPAPGRSGRAAT